MNRAQRRAAERGKGVLLEPSPAIKISMAHLWNEARGVSGFWHNSIVSLIGNAHHLKVGLRPIAVESGPFITRPRNTILDLFVENGDDYLLFTDTDTIFGPGDLKQLLEADAPIAGGLYFNASTGDTPSATALVEVEDSDSGSLSYRPLDLPEPDSLDQLETAPEYQPQEVAGVGMGFTLIRRDVAEKILAEFPHPFEFLDDRGEDLTFCLRAKSLGFPTILVPKARVGHVKTTIL